MVCPKAQINCSILDCDNSLDTFRGRGKSTPSLLSGVAEKLAAGQLLNSSIKESKLFVVSGVCSICGEKPKRKLVGVAGFEPTTSSSRTKRATKLRHTPREATTAYRTAPAPRQRALPRQPRRPAAAVRGRWADHIRSGRGFATHSGVE